MRRYNLTAQMYDSRYCEEQEAKYKAAMNGLKIDKSNIVLDLGCGSGLFFNHLTEKAEMVIGADISRQLLILAKDRNESNENVFLVLADADHLPFRQKVFNFMFAFTVLQNMPKPEDTLKQLREYAIQDACFVVSGLKAAFSLEVFGGFIDHAGLQIISIVNDNALRCYILACIQPKA
jgi:SAM-dependent methyltransferase